MRLWSCGITNDVGGGFTPRRAPTRRRFRTPPEENMQNIHIKTRFTPFLLIAIFFITIPGFAQRTDATFAGVVTDPSGAVLPGVDIELVNQGTGAATQQ